MTDTTSDIWEGQLISVSNHTTKKITIGNIYRPPRDINENYEQFNKEFTEFESRIQKTKGEVVIVGDFNIDLLKVEHKPKTKEYLDYIMIQGFFPKITLPTRFSEMNGTLIDNVVCRLSNTSINNDASITVTQLSDHLPYFNCLRTMKVDKPEPKYICIKQTTETSMNRVKHEIITASIYDKLNTHVNANPKINYDILDNKISQIIKTCMPLKRVKFDKHKHKKSNWITAGLIRSIQFRDKLNLKMKQTPTHSEAYANIKINLKTYNKILKRNIEQAKIMHYHQKLAKYTNGIKKYVEK